MMLSMKYSLSYTAASLRIQDTLLVAEAIQNDDFGGLDKKIGNGKTATGRRIRSELEKRLKNLTDVQLDFLLTAGLDDAKKMAFVAICKTYQFIYEFVVEVLREKILQLDVRVRNGEYLSFFNRKCELHPELEELTQNSKDKIRQVLFKMLEEAKLIDNVRTKNIQPQFLSAEFQDVLRADDPQLLRIFLIPQVDI